MVILIVLGAISSSGVTKAIYDYWEYFEPIREYGPPDCILATQRLTNIIDNILLGGNSTKGLITELKTAFGLQDVQYVSLEISCDRSCKEAFNHVRKAIFSPRRCHSLVLSANDIQI